MQVQLTTMKLHNLSLQSNEEVGILINHAGQQETFSILKGCLTMSVRMLRVGDQAELHKDKDYTILAEKGSDDSMTMWLLRSQEDSCIPVQASTVRIMGSRVSQNCHPDFDVKGMPLIGLHFVRRLPLLPSTRVARALFKDPQIDMPIHTNTAFSPSHDFCQYAMTGNAFDSLPFFNARTFAVVLSRVSRPAQEQTHSELALVALLHASLQTARSSTETNYQPKTLCLQTLELAESSPDAAKYVQMKLAAPFDKHTMLSLKFKTNDGLCTVRGLVGHESVLWEGPRPDILMRQSFQNRQPSTLSSRTPPTPRTIDMKNNLTHSIIHDIKPHSLHSTVHDIREAGRGNLDVQQIPYVQTRPYMSKMRPNEVLLSLLMNADTEIE